MRHGTNGIQVENSKNKKILFMFFRGLFSVLFVKDLVYSFVFYTINHTYGLLRVNKGKNVKFRPGVLLRDPERIYIGDYSSLGVDNILWAGKTNAVIKIGKNVMTGPSVKIFAFNHGMERNELPMIDQPVMEEDVIVGDDVWIGADVLIMPGCTIGSGSVVAAGSVVTKDIPVNSVCAGVPAKVIRER
ncbi:MAG: acyltransferase [Sulfurovaceae bacterium]